MSDVAFTPPAPRAPAVLAAGQSSRDTLAALNNRIGEAVLADLEGKPGNDLAELTARIAVAKLRVEGLDRAHEAALRHDRQARREWLDATMALDPAEKVAGITAERCCNRCGPDGCVITGNTCAHPVKVGRLPQGDQANPAIRAAWRAAHEALDAVDA